MHNQLFILIFASALGLAQNACVMKVSPGQPLRATAIPVVEKPKPPTPPATSGGGKSTEDLSHAGGLPGAISFGGKVFSLDQIERPNIGPIKIHKKISVDQTGGKGLDGQFRTLDGEALRFVDGFELENHLKTLNDKLSKEILPADLLVVGCEDIDDIKESFPEKEVRTEYPTSGLMMADTVILCGRIPNGYLGIQVIAHELILHDATISVSEKTESVSIEASHLNLLGQNRIISMGPNQLENVIRGPTITFLIFEALRGNGQLWIQDQGGNCTAR